MKASEMKGLWINPQTVYSWVGKREYPMVYLSLEGSSTVTPSYKWKIGDTSIVKLGDDGWLHSLKVGETTITAITDDGQYQKEATYRVEDGSNITITGFTFYDEYGSNRYIEKYTIGYGESVKLVARSFSPQDNGVVNRDIEINHGGVTWSTSDPEIATVVSDSPAGYIGSYHRGKITAGTKSGTVMVRVTSVTCPDVYSEFPIIVQPVVKHVQSIKINPSSLEIVIGQKYQAEAIITPSDATDQKLFWTVPIGTTCTVGGGLIHGVKKGSTRVTVTSQDGSISTSFIVKVTTDGVIPLSKLELSKYSIKVEMDSATETHYPSVTAYVPTSSGQDPANVGINVDIKDPGVVAVREIKVLSEKSNRRAVVFKGVSPGYTTVKISSKTDPTKFATLEVMTVGFKESGYVYLPYTVHVVPEEIEVERGQIFTIWAKGFGGRHYSKTSTNLSLGVYNHTWDGNWVFEPNSSQLEVVGRHGDTNQNYVWIRAGYIPGDYEITVRRYPGGVLDEAYGSRTVKVKIVDKMFNETIGELIPKIYYLCFMDKDEATQSDLNKAYIPNPYNFYLGWIKNASTDEKATRFKDSEYDNIGWKIARDGIISKIERSGSYLKIYRGPNYGITQVIFYLKSNPHVYYPCWVEYDGGDWRYYTTDKNVSIETDSSYTSSKPITNADISNGRVQSESTTQEGTVIPKSSSVSEGSIIVTETGTYRASTYNSKYNYKSDTGLIDNKPIETKNTKKISKGSFVDPDSKRGKNGSSLI